MGQTRRVHSVTACTCITLAIVFLPFVAHTNAHIWRRQAVVDARGTTPNIEAIFKGRCHEHAQCLQTDRCDVKRANVDCDGAWEKFLGVYQFVDPCNTPADAYDEVLNMLVPITPEDQHAFNIIGMKVNGLFLKNMDIAFVHNYERPISCNGILSQTLFWSGLLDAALNVARVSMQYRILEESLPGYVANNLNWCGDPNNSTSGVNYTTCPTSYDCTGETGFTYWMAASREFARQASGKVFVALNAHRTGGAFRNTSVFASVELPNLDVEKVNMVEILLVPDIKKPKNESEKCGEGSLRVLQRLIEQRGINSTCTYDPVEFRFIQCTTLENPTDYEACGGATSVFTSGSVLNLVIVVFGFAIKQIYVTSMI